MHWKLFLRELQSGLVTDGAVFLVAFSAFLFVERLVVGSGSTAEDKYVTFFLSVVVALLGFVFGTLAFPAEVKSRRTLVLYTLPTSRGSLWFSLGAGRFAAYFLASVGLFLVRPSLLVVLIQVGESTELTGRLFLACHPVLFAAGACSALVFRETITAFLVGLPLTLLALGQVLGLVHTGFSSSRPVGFEVGLWCLALVVLFSLFSLLSWRFFQLGEFDSLRRRLGNQGLATILLCVAVSLVGFGSWTPFVVNPPVA